MKSGCGLKKLASGCVFGICTALIGIIAVPTVLLFGIIHLIVRAMNFIDGKIKMK